MLENIFKPKKDPSVQAAYYILVDSVYFYNKNEHTANRLAEDVQLAIGYLKEFLDE